jgi:hypothetical protein
MAKIPPTIRRRRKPAAMAMMRYLVFRPESFLSFGES